MKTAVDKLAPALDAVAEPGDAFQIEVQLRPDGLRTLYIHCNGTTFVRIGRIVALTLKGDMP